MTDPTHPDDHEQDPETDLPPSDEPAPEDFEDREAQEAAAAKERTLEEAAAAAAASSAAKQTRAGRGPGAARPTASGGAS